MSEAERRSDSLDMALEFAQTNIEGRGPVGSFLVGIKDAGNIKNYRKEIEEYTFDFNTTKRQIAAQKLVDDAADWLRNPKKIAAWLQNRIDKYVIATKFAGSRSFIGFGTLPGANRMGALRTFLPNHGVRSFVCRVVNTTRRPRGP